MPNANTVSFGSLKWTVVSSPSSSYDAPVHSRFPGDDGRASPSPSNKGILELLFLIYKTLHLKEKEHFPRK
jgi:hypothetical protein